MRFALIAFLIHVAGMTPAFSASGEPLPDTELADVIVRNLDQKVFPGFPLYLGHAGILGDWIGNDAEDPNDYYVYDMQDTTSTVKSFPTYTHTTIKKRLFANFTLANSLTDQSYLSYNGGYVRSDSAMLSPPGTPMEPTLRAEIINKAELWVGADLTTKLIPFTKLPSTNTFRCDGWVEYVFEQAGIGSGQGLWKNYLEPLIAMPQTYASPFFVTRLEPGLAPTLLVTTIGGGEVSDGAAISSTTIIVSSTETATGSGLKKIVLSGPTSASRSVSGLTATETFSSLADGSYSVAVYDKAGNYRSAGFK